MRKEATVKTRLGVFLLSLLVASIIYLSVSLDGSNHNYNLFSASSEGVYVIEDIDIEYIYDTNQYEVVPFVNKPYAVVKGDKQLIHLLKWSGDPKFHINLTGKLPGTYREEVYFSGINEKLTVEVYPSLVELRIMEQETIRIQPTIELEGVEKIHDDYVISVPEFIDGEEVLIRDIQDKINQVSKVVGVVDVSKMRSTQEVEVRLTVINRLGEEMEDINLIDKTIKVRIPIEKKVTVINEEVVEEIVVIEGGDGNKEDETMEKEPDTTKEDANKNTDTKEEPNTDKPKDPVQGTRKGSLSFINLKEGYEFTHETEGLELYSDVKVDLKEFSVGVYEMTIDDNGKTKTIKFTIREKEKEETPPPSNNDNDKEDPNNDKTDTEPPNKEPTTQDTGKETKKEN